MRGKSIFYLLSLAAGFIMAACGGGGGGSSGGGGDSTPASETTIRVAVSSAGSQSNLNSAAPCVSSSGRFIAFESSATNLVTNDTNGRKDIFVHDRDEDDDGTFDESGLIATVRVSVNSSGAQVVDGNNSAPSISSNGRYVAFESTSITLVSGDTNGDQDIFVHDRDTDNDGIFDETGAIATVRVSVDSSGDQVVDGDSSAPAISTDGRYVAFQSTSETLVAGDSNGVEDIFVHDRDTDEDGVFDEAGFISTVRISVTSGGLQGNLISSDPSISSDGRHIAFASAATNLVSGDSNGVVDIFVHDRDTNGDGTYDEPGAISTVRVSVTSGGVQGNLASSSPTMSTDGRHIAFTSSANNLVSGDINTVNDIFVHDRDADEDGDFDESGAISIVRVSVTTGGVEGNLSSSSPSISPDGRRIVFASAASNLTESDTNGASDVFIHDRDTDADGVFDEPAAISTTRASVATDGTQGNSGSSSPVVNSNGKYVAFVSSATNLVSGDTNGANDIFVSEP